jgi:hypothetical protein
MNYYQKLEQHLNAIDNLYSPGCNSGSPSSPSSPSHLNTSNASPNFKHPPKQATKFRLPAIAHPNKDAKALYDRLKYLIVAKGQELLVIQIYDHFLPSKTLCLCWWSLIDGYILISLDQIDFADNAVYYEVYPPLGTSPHSQN